MRLTDYLPRWGVTSGSGPVPIGPAMTTLRSVIARLASLVRSAGVVYTAVQLTIWQSFYTDNWWRLLPPAAIMAWGSAVAVYLRRRSPPPLFACMDSAVYVVLALSAQGFVPPGIHDRAFNWLVISMSSQLIVPAWYARAALSLPLALASPAAYWIGAWQVAGTQTRITTATAILLVMVAGTHTYGRRQLYRRAAAADAALDLADQAASEQYVILSRNLERREHERLIHDTVLNTLTALARAGGDDVAEMVSRCRQDVVLIEAALGDPTDPGCDEGDLAGSVRAVAAQMRARGMTVHVKTTGEGTRVVPATVVTALANATREALTNVAAHSGTEEAWVEVIMRTARPVEVTVRDQGAGFDPARADPLRLGLRRSIAERTADCGGQASIRSVPGQGTTVGLLWPADQSW
jgi:signal transduction histidine kinase